MRRFEIFGWELDGLGWVWTRDKPSSDKSLDKIGLNHAEQAEKSSESKSP